MTKKIFYSFITLFFLVINYSVSTVKESFFERLLFFLLFVALFYFFSFIDLRKIFLLLTGIISPIIFSYGIIQKYILFPIYLKGMDTGISSVSKAFKGRIESGRIFSIFSLPTLYALVCAVLLIAIVHYILNSKSVGARSFWIILGLAGIFNLFLTQSFAGILYLLAGFPIYFYLTGRSNFKFLIPLLMIISVFLFIFIGLRFSEAKKLDPIKLRVSNWTQAFRMLRDNPISGIGIGNYEAKVTEFTNPGEAHSIYAHNFILQIAAEGGIAFLFIGLSLLILFRKRLKPEFNNENALYISILFIIILYNLIDIGLYFFSASLIFSLIISQIYRKRGPLPKSAVMIVFILLIPQLIISISSGIRRTGSFHLNFNRIDKAEKYFRSSLRYNRFNHRSLLGLAKTSYAKGDIDRSNYYLGKVIEMNRLSPYAHYLKSRILYIKKNYLSSFYHAGKARSLNKINIEYKKWFDFIRTNFSANLSSITKNAGDA